MDSIACCSIKSSNALKSNRSARPNLTEGSSRSLALVIDRVFVKTQVLGGFLDIQEPSADIPI